MQLGFALPATWLFIVANRAKLDSASHFWMVKLKATFFVRSLEAVVFFFDMDIRYIDQELAAKSGVAL